MLRNLCWLPAMLLAIFVSSAAAAQRPNVLIITVDDMSADSLGAFGCGLEGTSPHIDRLANSGLRFAHAHVQVGNCMPGRNVMWSGRMPHNNRVEGFYQVPDADYPVLADLMKEAGYFTAIRGKVAHSTPYTPYEWDLVLDTLPDGRRAHIKDAASYGMSTAHGIRAATEAGKPFCLMVNVSDPHKPFYAQDNRTGETIDDPYVPTRVFTPEEVPVPGFLFDDPVVRKELAHYYSSVRRADDCVGAVLSALEESSRAEETLVMFLSDHGMPLPFAKTQLYHHSTHTPLIIRWPGVTQADTWDRDHMVSAVDFLPTLLEVCGIALPEGLDGRSFAPLIRGDEQSERELVFKEYSENAGGSRDPMRGVQSKRFLYLFNPWSNGERVMATATTGTPTYRRFAHLAKSDPALAARHDLYQHRVPEEFYDVEKDPDCLHNLIDDPDAQVEIERLRDALAAEMRRTGDPALEIFLHRDDADLRETWVQQQEQQAEERSKARRQRPRRAVRRDARTGAQLIGLEPPASIAGGGAALRIRHDLPGDLGRQKLQVTLKAGPRLTRVERKIVRVSGSGTVEVRFDVPEEAEGPFRFAAFVGDSYDTNLQHVQSPPIRRQ
jgi:N-sulfoglucosamine sulfohydrolase